MKHDTEHGGGGGPGSTAAPTLADVLAYIEVNSNLSPTRRRDLRSSIKIVARVLDREPALIPALPSRLREEFAKVHPAAHRISIKTWATVRSNALSAVELSGVVKVVRTSRHTVTPDWHALWQQLPTKELRNGLSRFFRYASARGITPADVDDAVLASFKSDLDAHSVVRNPEAVHRATAHLWNLAVSKVPGFPGTKITLPDYRKRPMRAYLASLPASFTEDLERYLAWCRVSDVFDPQARVRPLKATTLRMYREQINSAVAAAVEAGIEPTRLASLKDLLEPSIFKEILRRRHVKAGGKPNALTVSIAKMLIAMAKEWAKLDPMQITELKALAAKLPKLPPGLTEKNWKLVAWFNDQGNLARFLALPDRLWARAMSERLSSKRALVKAQDALLIGLLMYVPLRRANLTRLEFGRHISWPGGSRRPALLFIPAAEMKNGQPYEAEIGEPLAARMWTYRERIVPAAVGTESSFLFVNVDGTVKSPDSVATRFSRLMRQELGLVMSPHQTRHVLAKLVLDNNPAAMELVRQLLGHASMKTTVNYYGGTDTRRAVRYHSELIQRLREETKSRLVRRRAGNAAPHRRGDTSRRTIEST
jgi:integrase